MNEQILIFYSISVLILTLSPGPDILFLISTTLNKNFKTALNVATGLCLGLLIHTIFTAFGLGYLLTEYPRLISLTRLIGCIYLGYLSYLYFPKKNSISGINHNFNFIEKPLFQGLVMNLVNPKIILFFVSFFPQFIFHNKWEIKTQFYILGLMFTTIAFVTFVSVLSVLNLTKSQMKLGKQSKNISYLSSAMLLGLSAYFFCEEIKNIMELI